MGGTVLEQNGEMPEAGAAENSALAGLNRETTNTRKELWNSDYSQELDVTLDHRLLTEDGRNEIKQNAQDSYEFGQDIGRATQTILDSTDLNVTNIWTTLTNNTIGTQIKNELTRNAEYSELLTALQSEDADVFAQAFKELGVIAQSKFGLTPDQFGDIFLYDGNTTTSTSLGNTLFADTKGGTILDPSHPEYGNIAVNAAGGVKTEMVNTLGHETIEVLTLRTGGANDAAQEAQARAFGAQLADRINQAAGGKLDSSSGNTFTTSLQNSYAVTQGTVRANTVGNAQVDHRRLRVAETETLERTRMAIAESAGMTQDEKEIAQLQLNALACSAVKCANGVPKDDPLYNQLLALQTAGETLNQQGTSLDSILGEEAGGQFEHGLKARFDDLLTSQNEAVVRTAGAGQAVAGALGMVGGITMGAASAAGCVPSAGLSCAGVVAGSAITVLSLEQGRAGMSTAFGNYQHTEGQAVMDSLSSTTHRGDHNPSLDLAIDVGIASTELVAAKLGAKYLEKALEGKVVRSEAVSVNTAEVPDKNYPDGLAFRTDLPAHLFGPHGFKNNGTLHGTHNQQNAIDLLIQKGATYKLTPTTNPGISELEYSYLNAAKNKTVAGSKTVYDPKVYSDQQILDMSQVVGQKGFERYLGDTSKTVFDIPENGVNFRVYINIDPTTGAPYVGNVHPIK